MVSHTAQNYMFIYFTTKLSTVTQIGPTTDPICWVGGGAGFRGAPKTYGIIKFVLFISDRITCCREKAILTFRRLMSTVGNVLGSCDRASLNKA